MGLRVQNGWWGMAYSFTYDDCDEEEEEEEEEAGACEYRSRFGSPHESAVCE